MGDRSRVSRKRMFFEQTNPEFQPLAKLPRLHAPESLMPPPLSDHKDIICSCPPFECLCRPLPSRHSDAFLGQNPMLPLPPVGQQALLSPTALSFSGAGHVNSFDSLDLMDFQQPLMRDTYSEYFDLSPIDRFHPSTWIFILWPSWSCETRTNNGTKLECSLQQNQNRSVQPRLHVQL